MAPPHYKDDEAIIEFDEHANTFNGEVANIRDVITFQGSSAAALKEALAESEDDLAFCAGRGEEPEKSGYYKR